MPGQVVGPSNDNRLEVFAVGRDNNLWHIWQTAPSNGWSAWYNRGKPQEILRFSSPPAVVRNPAGRLELFITGIDGRGLGRVCHIWQDTPSGPWPRWWVHDGPPNGVHSAPAAGLNQDGRIEVFVIESDSHYLWSQPQTGPSNGWAQQWSGFGAPSGIALVGSPGVGRNADGRQAVFAVGKDSLGSLSLWMKEQFERNGRWTDWQSLGGWDAGWSSSPVVASNADGRMEVFMVGGGQLWHIWQTAPNTDMWSAWESFGSPQEGGARRIGGTPAVGSNFAVQPSGRLEVFVVTDSGGWWHRWQIAPNGGWSDWDNTFLLGRLAEHGDLAVASNADGRLEVLGCSGDLVHTWQDLGSDNPRFWFKGHYDQGFPVSAPPDSLGYPGAFPELLPWTWPLL